MKAIFIVAAAVAITATFLPACQENAANNMPVDLPLTQTEMIERGRYLVFTSACNDCHTPKKMTDHGPVIDESRLLSGHPAAEPFPTFDPKLISEQNAIVFSPGLTAAAGPWGTITYAANLTPDDTGTGAWTEAQFMKAIREGKSKGLDGTRPLLPPMPWDVYAQMKDEDLKAIYAYIKSIKPVQNVVPQPKPLQDL
jgi:hypothetical protein